MANLFKLFETDVEKERGGVEVKIGDASFWVRRAGGSNRGWQYALHLAAKRHAAELREDEGPNLFNVQEQIIQEAFADCVIVRWDNVDGRDGQPLECNRENFLDLVNSCPTIWDALKEAGIDNDRFKKEAADGELVGKPSCGNLSGDPESLTSNDSPRAANG